MSENQEDNERPQTKEVEAFTYRLDWHIREAYRHLRDLQLYYEFGDDTDEEDTDQKVREETQATQ